MKGISAGVWPDHAYHTIRRRLAIYHEWSVADRIASARAKAEDNEFSKSSARCLSERKSWCYILLVCNDLAILLWGRGRHYITERRRLLRPQFVHNNMIMMSISCQIQQTKVPLWSYPTTGSTHTLIFQKQHPMCMSSTCHVLNLSSS